MDSLTEKSLREKNAGLEKELALKNRELEIEAALERVRTVAMGMGAASDLLGICQILFEELTALGFAELRSAMINIVNDEKGSFLNYGFQAGSGGTVTYFQYDSHPVIKRQVAMTRSGSDAFFEHILTGDELEDFKTFRVSNGEAPDPKLENISALYYYFYSIGVGSVGISTLSSLAREKREMLKRFRNVFDLAYRRYIDIELAEAQARQAQIELGLERVRARAMAMQSSGELSDLVTTVSNELARLDFALSACIINIIDGDSRTNTVWFTGVEEGMALQTFHMKFEAYPFHDAMWNAWKAKKAKYVYTLEGQEKRTYDDYLLNETEFSRISESAKAGLRAMERFVCSFTFCNFGGLQTVGTEPLSDANLDILARFGKVFDLTYTRFNDLKQAETQAREAQIELALERVRARTMAMQRSQELAETAFLLFSQFKALGENPDQATIGIINQQERVIEYWVTMHGRENNSVFKFSIDEPNVTRRIYDAWKAQESSLVIDLSGKPLREFMKYRQSMGGAAVNKAEKRRIINVAIFSKGLINVQSTAERSPESIRLLERFAQVFDQTYTRFLDLQKAEAQARESLVQLALERIRARTMAMQKSSELAETVSLVFKQLLGLGINTEQIRTCGIVTFNTSDHTGEQWITETNGEIIPQSFTVPYDEAPAYKAIYDSWIKGEQFKIIHLTGEALKEHLGYLAKYTKVPVRDVVTPTQASEIFNHVLYFSQGCLFIITKEPMAAYHDIFKRFGAVFQQSYTRFLDLQKAEAQAHESQIELALERVRARSMAMQKSEELREIIQVVFEQFVHLNILVEHTGFIIDYDTNEDMHIWLADQHEVPYEIRIPYFDSPHWNSFIQAKAAGDNFFVNLLSFEEKNKFYRDLFQLIPGVPDQTIAYYMSCPGLAGSTVLMENVGLYIENFSGIPYSDDDNATLRRFGKVFQQTYTRFLDLQKAEAQAREAQIEAALERVRSKTMAMHSSTDVADTVGTMFNELVKLGVEKAVRCGIGILSPDNPQMEIWTAKAGENEKPELIIGHLDMSMHPMLEGIYQAWHQHAPSYSYVLADNDRINYYELINKQPDYPIKYDISKLPSPQYNHDFIFSEGVLFAFTSEPLSAEISSIFKRFAGVFGQTYRRFLDLQKAEAQAKEAQIQLALERVRARTMAMQRSDELAETATVLFQQLLNLGIASERTFIATPNDETRKFELWGTEQGGHQMSTRFEYEADATYAFREIYKAWQQKKTTLTVILKGKNLQEHINYVRNVLHMPLLPELVQEQRILYNAFFSKGLLMIVTPKTQSNETLGILERFAGVFDGTYTRFLDLQKAEEAARETIKQASVDRVRGEIASMRTVGDLARITPLIWNELTILGIPFIRCGVFIADEQAQVFHSHLSTPDGKALAAFNLEFDSQPLGQVVLPAWRKKQAATHHWSAEEFAAYTKNLVDTGTVKAGERYVTEHPDTSLDLHFLPFLQGMLYVGNITPLTEEEMNLVQSLADAFSTAYARYEDFNKLEAAKEQVENTLSDLRAAQTKLIQSEKMASLGELTAGIAHEIQNPLNFVNNFSDVSIELVDEMLEELDKGDKQEVIAISEDIKQNLEKIRHHGQRADAIVKGMLQHSRSSGGDKQPTNINTLADEFFRLSYHGLRAKDKTFNAELLTHFDPGLPKINVIGQDIGRVLLNLFNNAFYAVNQKKKTAPADYKPEVAITTSAADGKVIIRVRDNGTGMPEHLKEKIMQPFFTTKPTGEGTGLGLSLTYDMVVKGHGGSIGVESTEGEGSEFIIRLPIK